MSESSPSNPELREAVVAYQAGVDDKLEFPVAPDFASRPPRMTPDEYVVWCEEMMTLFPPRPDRAARRVKARCEVALVI